FFLATAPSMMPRISLSFMIRRSSPSTRTSVPDHLPNRMRSPAFTSSGVILPSSPLMPAPAAITSPSCGFSLAVSGMVMPPGVFATCSTRLVRTRVWRGGNFVVAPRLSLSLWPLPVGTRPGGGALLALPARECQRFRAPWADRQEVARPEAAPGWQHSEFLSDKPLESRKLFTFVKEFVLAFDYRESAWVCPADLEPAALEPAGRPRRWKRHEVPNGWFGAATEAIQADDGGDPVSHAGSSLPAANLSLAGL